MRLAPREPNPYDSLGDVYLRMGAPEKALDYYSRAHSLDPTFSTAGQAWSLAVMGRYDLAVKPTDLPLGIRATILARVGRYREAAEMLAAGVKATIAAGNMRVAGSQVLLSAMLAIERKQYARAIQDVDSGRRLFAQVDSPDLALADLLDGIAHVRSGRMAEARADLESQRRGPSLAPIQRWSNMLQGEIALAEGDLRGAAVAFSAGEPARKQIFWNAGEMVANNLPSRDGLARVAKARGDVTGALQIYRRLLAYGNEHNWVSAFEPRYVFEIARLLDLAGDKKSARLEYERFLELWKNADEDLPELAEARQAVARINAAGDH
jgi:tetratricopeptide (TPR) repeat protein